MNPSFYFSEVYITSFELALSLLIGFPIGLHRIEYLFGLRSKILRKFAVMERIVRTSDCELLFLPELLSVDAPSEGKGMVVVTGDFCYVSHSEFSLCGHLSADRWWPGGEREVSWLRRTPASARTSYVPIIGAVFALYVL